MADGIEWCKRNPEAVADGGGYRLSKEAIILYGMANVVMLGAKGSSIVLKILMGMLSPPHRRRALAVGSPRRDREAAIIRTASKASEGCGQREESLSPQGEL